MRRTLTALALSAAATLVLTSCGTEDQPQPGAVPAAPTAVDTSSTEHSHPATTTPDDSVVPTSDSTSTAEGRGGHVHAAGDPKVKDASYKNVPLKKGTTYVIASSTDQTRFRLTIESFDCKTSYPEASYTAAGTATAFTAASGKKLCIVEVSGENIGKAPDHAALNYFAVLVDTRSEEYDETTSPNFTTEFLMGTKAPLEKSVDPGSTGWIVLGYEVPTTAEGAALRIDTAPPSH